MHVHSVCTVCYGLNGLMFQRRCVQIMSFIKCVCSWISYLCFPVCSLVVVCELSLSAICMQGWFHCREERRGLTLWLVQELLDNRCPAGWEVDYLWRRERVEREWKKSGGGKWWREEVRLLQCTVSYSTAQKYNQPNMTTFRAVLSWGFITASKRNYFVM